MSLRKSPTMTPARIEANRRNAQKSTGPRTARGKAQSRMNSLRTGRRSRFLADLCRTLLYAPPYSVDRTAQAILTPEQAAHPLFREMVDLFRETEAWVAENVRRLHPPAGSSEKNATKNASGA